MDEGVEMISPAKEEHKIQVDPPEDVHVDGGVADTTTQNVPIQNLTEEHDNNNAPSLVPDAVSRAGLPPHSELGQNPNEENDNPNAPFLLVRSTAAVNPSIVIRENISIAKKSLLMVILGGVAFGIYAAIFNLEDSHNGNSSFPVEHPELLPIRFYLITSMTVAFALSMFGAVISLRSIISEWPFFVRGLLVLVLGSLFQSYALIVMEKVPKFCVTINESIKINSFWMVWLSLIALVFFTLAMSGLVQLFVFGYSILNKPRDD